MLTAIPLLQRTFHTVGTYFTGVACYTQYSSIPQYKMYGGNSHRHERLATYWQNKTDTIYISFRKEA